MPNGQAPGTWKCPSPSPARSQARSSLSMPRTRSGSIPNFSTQSCQVSAGGVCTGRPSRRASRSWYGAVRTTAVARSRSSSGTESGSNNRKSSPSSIAYDDTSSGHHSSSFQSGCGDCQCQTPARSSCMSTVCHAGLLFKRRASRSTRHPCGAARPRQATFPHTRPAQPDVPRRLKRPGTSQNGSDGTRTRDLRRDRPAF